MQRDAFALGGFGAAIHAAADSGELTAEEAPIVARSLLSAGVDTTVSGLGAAVCCLARFPEQFARLRADPSLARAAFEEAVRYQTPAAGRPLGKGVLLLARDCRSPEPRITAWT
jgi:cytochrome P450